MRKSLGWLLLLILCSAAGGETAGVTPDARLLEARTELEHAKQARKKGDLVQALVWARSALLLRETVLGDTHPDVAACLVILGEIYWEQRDLPQAEKSFSRALSLWTATPGASRSQLANAWDNLALLYVDLGLYDNAEKHFIEALAIKRTPFDENQLKTTSILHHLADLYRTQGRYEKAESLYLEALNIRKNALGENHPQVATTFNHLAELYEKQGLYALAESFYLRALYLRKAAFGEKHIQFAASLKGLASIYRRRGSNEAAEKFLQAVLSIRETTFGPTHPSVATVLEMLAHLYLKRGDDEQALPLYERTLAIRKKAFGEVHVSVALTHNNLARLHWRQGDYERAKSRYELALAIREKTLGPFHPSVATTLNDLAQLLLAQRRLSDAIPFLTRAFTISEQRLRRESIGFSESRLAEFLYRLHANEHVLYSLVSEYPENAEVRRLALSSMLLLKGRSVEELTSIYRTLQQRLNPEDLRLFDDLRRSRVQLAKCSQTGRCVASARGLSLTQLVEEGDQLETKLAKNSAELRALTQPPHPEEIVGHVAQRLPRDGALIEFIVYRHKPLALPPRVSPTSIPIEPRYLALVLLPDTTTSAVDLGPVGPIDDAVSSLRKQLSSPHGTAREPAQRLHERVWRPLLPLLGSTRRIWLSPDGQLGLVPFHALHDGQQYLLDSFEFTYLTSGKQLLSSPEKTTPASSIFVLAIPELEGSGGGFPRLENVAKEADGIQQLLPQAHVFRRSQVTRDLLFHLSSPGILHIATHGDFFGEETASGPPTRKVFKSPGQESFPSKSEQEPLLNSGILVADPLAHPPGSDSPSVKIAFVTALELAGLQLRGTQLVVLSSCVSGLGQVQPGQGVYGLRRSLEIAGAETLVMSLWNVDDSSTADLMVHYYGNLLKGQGRSSALREAMRTVRDSQPEPHYWAPFFAQGSDDPLRGISPEPPSMPREDEREAEDTLRKQALAPATPPEP